MDEARKFEVALQFRQLAELNYQNENLSDACFYYMNAVKIRPEWKADLKDRFIVVLSKSTSTLDISLLQTKHFLFRLFRSTARKEKTILGDFHHLRRSYSFIRR